MFKVFRASQPEKTAFVPKVFVLKFSWFLSGTVMASLARGGLRYGSMTSYLDQGAIFNSKWTDSRASVPDFQVVRFQVRFLPAVEKGRKNEETGRKGKGKELPTAEIFLDCLMVVFHESSASSRLPDRPIGYEL